MIRFSLIYARISNITAKLFKLSYMYSYQHHFHIPVMGTGHSVDSPIRVAHLGIDSVISVVDDTLLEKIRKYYANEYSLPYQNIGRTADDSRARRVAAYLETVQEIVRERFEQLKNMPVQANSEKDRYFNLLPDSHPLKKSYQFLSSLTDPQKRAEHIEKLTQQMKPGSVDVNIMAKVDSLRTDKNNKPLAAEFSDACAALRGYAMSSLSSKLVLSAGFNPRLYSYIAEFKDFYRDNTGDIKKKIVLKVSDFRSALIQGKFLAKKGLEVAEFRIESGLNCGGHAFASEGHLLPVLLQEFREKRQQLADTFRPLVRSFYESIGREYPVIDEKDASPAITVQGGIGTHGEMKRLMEVYDMDATGWGSPFLLVPEATCVDDTTTQLLAEAGDEELYLSNVSPLGVPFNNVRGSGSDIYTKAKVLEGKPGSKCPKGYLVSNTEFTEEPICTASSQYQLLKIEQIKQDEISAEEKENLIDGVLDKTCLCENLGTSSLIRLGIRKESYGRQEVCPGPNIASFDRSYTLNEMVDHIYGRIEPLTPANRPHMFARELTMYVDYIEQLLAQAGGDEKQIRRLGKMKSNLETGMDVCEKIAAEKPYETENLNSLAETTRIQRNRLEELFSAEVSVC